MSDIMLETPIIAPQTLGYTSAPVWTGTVPVPSQAATPFPVPGVVATNRITYTPPPLAAGITRRLIAFLAWYGDGADARTTVPVDLTFTFLPEGQDTPTEITLNGILISGGWVCALPFLDTDGSRRALTNMIWNADFQPTLVLGGFTNEWSKGMGYFPAPGDGIYEAVKALRSASISPAQLCDYLSGIKFSGCGTTNAGSQASAQRITGLSCEPNPATGPAPINTATRRYQRLLPHS